MVPLSHTHDTLQCSPLHAAGPQYQTNMFHTTKRKPYNPRCANNTHTLVLKPTTLAWMGCRDISSKAPSKSKHLINICTRTCIGFKLSRRCSRGTQSLLQHLLIWASTVSQCRLIT